MKEKEYNSIYNWAGYKGQIKRDSEYLIKSIKENIRENFYLEAFQVKEGRKLSIDYIEFRWEIQGMIRRQLYDNRLDKIIMVAREDTEYHKNAQILLKYLEKILTNLENYNKYLLEDKKDEKLNKPLKSVFETEEDEKKFYELAEDYLYGGFEATLEKCKKVPSEYILKIWEV